MRFAVVGDIEEAIFLVRGVFLSSQHDLAVSSVTGPLAAAMNAAGIPLQLAESPEVALTEQDLDAVIVAATDAEQSIYLCRQASQSGQHVIVLPPSSASTAFSFEAHLLLDESEAGIIPFLGRWYGSCVRPVGVTVADNVRQLAMQLPMAEPDLLKQLQMHAIDLMCGCGFRFTQVTALDVPGADGQPISRSITLASAATAEDRSPPAVITFTNEMDPQAVGYVAITTTDGMTKDEPSFLPPLAHPAEDQPGEFVSQLCDELVNPAVCQRRMEGFSNTMELIEGVERSLRRRRTIDVYLDSVSERGAFKTQMTAIGCGVMAYVTFGLIVMAIMHAVGIPDMLMRVGFVLWVGPVVVYLLAQLLLPLARDRVVPEAGSSGHSEPANDV